MFFFFTFRCEAPTTIIVDDTEVFQDDIQCHERDFRVSISVPNTLEITAASASIIDTESVTIGEWWDGADVNGRVLFTTSSN